MYEHKEDIINTRKGCLGGSDAKMLQQIVEAGYVPKSAYKRLAVCKGLIEPQQFTNAAMEYGNYIEACVFACLNESDRRWQSNPCLVSDKYSRPNCKVIDHVDFLLQDDENKILTLGECKATRLTIEQTRGEYAAQLSHHYVMGKELAEKLGDYQLRVILCHYSTDGIDVDSEPPFDESRLTVRQIRFGKTVPYDIERAMNIVDAFLEDFNEYYDGDEIPSELLPENVKTEFDVVTTMLTEIKEREAKIDEFKRRLYDFMLDKNIKGIRSEEWSITRVDASESKSFDGKKYLEDLKALHPRKAKKIEKKYTKTVARGGYVKILVRKDNKS